MKKFGILLLIIGSITLFRALNMDTSIATETKGIRVNNIGLINDKQNMITAAGIAIIVGAIFTALAGKNSQNGSNYLNQTAYHTAAIKLKENNFFAGTQTDLSNDEYIIWLVSRYGIERNETLGGLILNKKVFPSIEEALIHADSLYKAELSAKEKQAANTPRVGKIGTENCDYVIQNNGMVLVTHPAGLKKIYTNLDEAIAERGPITNHQA